MKLMTTRSTRSFDSVLLSDLTVDPPLACVVTKTWCLTNREGRVTYRNHLFVSLNLYWRQSKKKNHIKFQTFLTQSKIIPINYLILESVPCLLMRWYCLYNKIPIVKTPKKFPGTYNFQHHWRFLLNIYKKKTLHIYIKLLIHFHT